VQRPYRTSEGTFLTYARTGLGLRQHLARGVFAEETLCGHWVSQCSTAPIRTPIGLTCLWCSWRARRHDGTVLPAPGARLVDLLGFAVSVVQYVSAIYKRDRK
jgi:hypothetical protein